MLTEIHEIDVVEVVRDIPGTPVTAGMIGAVLIVFDDGKAFDVEFVREDGSTLYEGVMPADALRLITSYET